MYSQVISIANLTFAALRFKKLFLKYLSSPKNLLYAFRFLLILGVPFFSHICLLKIEQISIGHNNGQLLCRLNYDPKSSFIIDCLSDCFSCFLLYLLDIFNNLHIEWIQCHECVDYQSISLL